MNEPSWLAASVPGYIAVEVEVSIPFGSTTWEAVCVGCDSAMREALSSAKEATGTDLSERMDSMEWREITHGIFERSGETM
jgi:hypothetical protein